MSRVIFLDRDGVINTDSLAYIKTLDEFVVIPESINAMVRLTQAGYKIGVATNQSGVSRGLYSEAMLNAIHQKLIKLVSDAGGAIDAIEYCIHLPEAQCICRKPATGMLERLAKTLDADLADVYFVGDRCSDIEAALKACAKPVLVRSPMTEIKYLSYYPQVPVYDSLALFVDFLLNTNHNSSPTASTPQRGHDE